MSIAQSMLPEFDQETGTTKRVLERIPAEKLGWRPHEKSFTLGDLGSHVANLMTWGSSTLRSTEFDVNPKDGPAFEWPRYGSPEEILSGFETNAAEARAALAEATDQDLFQPWSLKNAGETLFTMPRVACIRAFVFNHMIHHRGQLSVYLRLCDVAVPSIYGPTADEAI